MGKRLVMGQRDQKTFNRALESLARFQAAEAVYDDSAAVAGMLRGESDRALIIILASYIEDALLERIIYMLPEGERYGATIFKGGALRNFEHRIAIAKAVGAIDEKHSHILDGIRAMRNACSHSRKPISFKTPELLNAFAATLGQEASAIFQDSSDIPEVRAAFILTASMLLWALRTAPGENMRPDTGQPVSESARTEQLLLAALRKKLPHTRPANYPDGPDKD
jgi:hypothetical protein